MADTKKLEMALECLLNEEDGKAGELLHEFIVHSARDILEDIESSEAVMESSEDMEGDFAQDVEGEEMYSDDELDTDGEEDMDADPALDIDPENETVEERLMDLEDALEELQAEFASLGGEEDDADEFDSEMDSDEGAEDELSDDDAASDVEDDVEELEAEELGEAVDLLAVPKVNPAEGQPVGSDSTGGGSTDVNDKSSFLQNSGKKGVDGKTQTLAPKSSSEARKDSTSNTGQPSGKGKGVPAGTGEVHNRLSGKAEKTYSKEKKQAIKKDTSGDKGDKGAGSLVSGKKIR